MPLRTELKAKLLISNDNVPTPQDIAFNSGDVIKVDSATYAEATSKVLNIAPSTTNYEVDLDNIASVAVLYLFTNNTDLTVTLVPTGQVLADCKAIKLLPGFPMLVSSDLAAVHITNANALNSATVKVGAVGN